MHSKYALSSGFLSASRWSSRQNATFRLVGGQLPEELAFWQSGGRFESESAKRALATIRLSLQLYDLRAEGIWTPALGEGLVLVKCDLENVSCWRDVPPFMLAREYSI